MTPEELKEFARHSPEQVEARKWAKWVEQLRRRDDQLGYETQRDYDEDKDDLYR